MNIDKIDTNFIKIVSQTKCKLFISNLNITKLIQTISNSYFKHNLNSMYQI